MDLLKVGASLIQNSSDDATTGLDSSMITDALGSLLGSGAEGGGLDLGALLSNIAGSGEGAAGLMEIASSWLGQGENAAIEPDQIGELLGSDKVTEFAEKLGISEESARKALADSIPEVVNQASPEGGSDILGSLLAQVGGAEGAIGMLGKMFGR